MRASRARIGFDGPVTFSVRRAATAALALAALAPLAACSGGPEIHPGAAAVVDGDTITMASVDSLAAQLCTLEEPGLEQQGAVLPMGLLRSVAVESLVTDALLPLFADEVGIDMTAVRRGVRDQVEKVLADAPASLRDEARERLQMEGERRAVLDTIGGAAGGASPQAGALGAQVFAAWRADQEVTIDPRFGAVDLDALQWDGANGSLSIPADTAADPLDQDAVKALPADQSCGAPRG